ncbi:MAG: hypothetical protein KKD44_26955 [Proteobacteria bacterium]|nr:hypothetical protein [Pseudomonadota bacterium]
MKNQDNKEQARKAEAAEFAGGIPNYVEELELDDEKYELDAGLIDKDKIPCSVDEMYEEARLGHPHAIAWVLRRTLHLERTNRYQLKKVHSELMRHIIRDSVEMPRRLRFAGVSLDGNIVRLKGFLSTAPLSQCFGGDTDPDGWHDQPIEFYMNVDLGTRTVKVSPKY